MTKILIIISLIAGIITATVDYLKKDNTQQQIEQLKDLENNDKI